jgi:hypothetical protein
MRINKSAIRVLSVSAVASTALCAFSTTAASYADEIINAGQSTTIEQKTESVSNSVTPQAIEQVPILASVQGKSEVASLQFRVDRMREQINLGSSKGWLNPDDANALKGKADLLASEISNLTTKQYFGFNQSRADDLERKANSLNIDISDAMKNAPAQAISSAPIITQ